MADDSSEDVYFWVFILLCVVAFLMLMQLNKGHKFWRLRKVKGKTGTGSTVEGFEGIYRMDPTDIANPDPKNVYVTLNALTEAEKNFEADVGPYML
jgi:hypothetical protein